MRLDSSSYDFEWCQNPGTKRANSNDNAYFKMLSSNHEDSCPCLIPFKVLWDISTYEFEFCQKSEKKTSPSKNEFVRSKSWAEIIKILEHFDLHKNAMVHLLVIVSANYVLRLPKKWRWAVAASYRQIKIVSWYVNGPKIWALVSHHRLLLHILQ